MTFSFSISLQPEKREDENIILDFVFAERKKTLGVVLRVKLITKARRIEYPMLFQCIPIVKFEKSMHLEYSPLLSVFLSLFEYYSQNSNISE